MRLQDASYRATPLLRKPPSTAKPRRVGQYECRFHNNYYANQILFRATEGWRAAIGAYLQNRGPLEPDEISSVWRAFALVEDVAARQRGGDRLEGGLRDRDANHAARDSRTWRRGASRGLGLGKALDSFLQRGIRFFVRQFGE
jgi:hypothetical protein